MQGRVRLTQYTPQQLDAAVDAQLGPGASRALDTNIFKRCSGARLKLPFLLTDIPAVLHIDWDTAVLCDVRLLWRHFAHFGPRQVFGLGLADTSGINPWAAYLRLPTVVK